MEVIGSLVLAIIQSILFYDKKIGISMLIFEIVANSIIFFILKRKDKIKKKSGFLLMIPILLLSSTYFIFGSRTFYISNFVALGILDVLMVLTVTGKTDYLIDGSDLFAYTISGIGTTGKFTKKTIKKSINNNKRIKGESVQTIVFSIIFVLCIVVIIIGLLTSADSIFADMFSGIKNILRIINIRNVFDFILRFAIISLVYFIFLSFTLVMQKEKVEIEKVKSKRNYSKFDFTIKLLLIALNIVYVVFCYVQIKSLFAKINLVRWI